MASGERAAFVPRVLASGPPPALLQSGSSSLEPPQALNYGAARSASSGWQPAPASRFGGVAVAGAVATCAAAAASRRRAHAKRANPALVLRGRRMKAALKAAEREVSTDASPGASRIVAIVGADGSGKSKLCAALLEVDEPNAPPPDSKSFANKSWLLESEPAEYRRNFTCYNHFYSPGPAQETSEPHLHYIDTPGHVDRLPHVDHALDVAHGSVMVCRVSGLFDTSCSRILHAMDQAKKPKVVFVNGVDEVDGQVPFEDAVDNLELLAGVRPVVLFAPVHIPGTGTMLLNVLRGTLCSPMGCSLDDRSGSTNLPEKVAGWAQDLRNSVLDALAEVDDQVMEVYLEKGDVPRKVLDAALRKAAASGSIIPLVAGSAKSGLGIDALQDVIKTFVPLGDESRLMAHLGVVPSESSGEEPFIGWAFGRHKLQDQRGDYYFEVRVLSGTLRENDTLKMVNGGELDTVSFQASDMLHHGVAGTLHKTGMAGRGDIVLVRVPPHWELPKGQGHVDLALIGASAAVETAAPKPLHANRRGRCTFRLQIESLDKRDRAKLEEALKALMEEDDGLRLDTNSETGELLLSCMGMLHLDLLRERLAEDFQVLQLPLGEPHVAYHIALRSAGSARGEHHPEGKTRIRKGIEHKHKKEADAWVSVELKPSHRGEGITIEGVDDLVESGKVAKELRPSILKGIEDTLRTGGPGGRPVVDVIVQVRGAEASKEKPAVVATTEAVQSALKASESASAVSILEPMVELEVDVPDKDVDAVMGDLKDRNAEQVYARESNGEETVVDAEVALREVVNYSKDLHKLTKGQGSFTFRLVDYREVHGDLEKKLLQNMAEA